jgi:restriction endonuclease S subunit
MSVPALRFKNDDGQEFSEWVESTIGERVTEKSSKFNPEKSSDTFNCIELEHISQNTGELLGYTDTSLSKSIKNKFVTGDILFGKLRPYLKKFLKAPFSGVCSTEIWVLKGQNISNGYLFQFVQTEYFITQTNISSGSKMPRADWGVVSSAPAYFPSLQEQTKIANFLTAVDNKISLLTQKASLLSQYKKGVMQQIFSQELRFKDDDGQEFPEWEEKTLGDVLDYEQPTKYLVSSTEYSNDFKTPVLTAGKTFILGYTDETVGICEQGLPVIIFDDFTTAFKFVPFPFKAKSSAMKILRKKDGVNINFIYSAMQEIDFQSGDEHKRYWISEYSRISIPHPSIPEQTKIANFLTALDEKITNNQTQLNAVKQYKQGLLQQMFV